jgi:hypothetical protein
MLVGTPLPVKLSVFRALGPPLWIGRVLFQARRSRHEERDADRRKSEARKHIAPLFGILPVVQQKAPSCSFWIRVR